MRHKSFFLGLCLVFSLILACGSKEEISELETTLSDTQAKLEQKSRQLKELELQLSESEKNRKASQQDVADLQARYDNLEKARQQLAQTLEETKLELEKKYSTLQQKDEIIREHVDAKRRLNTRLQSQIEAREKKIEELELKLSESDDARLRLETNLQSQIEAREKKIEELERVVSELEKTKQNFETTLMDFKERNTAQEQKIIAQRNIIAELDATRLTIEDKLQYRQSQLAARGKKIEALETTIDKLARTRHQIETDLKKQIKAQQVKLEEMEGKLTVTFVDKILFNSGSVRINQEGKDLLLALAASFRQNQNHNIIVRGHTDNLLIKPEFRDKYPTNWELSAARSAAVVRYLQEKAGIDPKRCAACGYSFYKPIATNETEDGRLQNRRIEIVLAPPR